MLSSSFQTAKNFVKRTADYAAQHPFIFATTLFTAVGALGLGGYGLTSSALEFAASTAAELSGINPIATTGAVFVGTSTAVATAAGAVGGAIGGAVVGGAAEVGKYGYQKLSKKRNADVAGLDHIVPDPVVVPPPANNVENNNNAVIPQQNQGQKIAEENQHPSEQNNKNKNEDACKPDQILPTDKREPDADPQVIEVIQDNMEIEPEEKSQGNRKPFKHYSLRSSDIKPQTGNVQENPETLNDESGNMCMWDLVSLNEDENNENKQLSKTTDNKQVSKTTQSSTTAGPTHILNIKMTALNNNANPIEKTVAGRLFGNRFQVDKTVVIQALNNNATVQPLDGQNRKLIGAPEIAVPTITEKNVEPRLVQAPSHPVETQGVTKVNVDLGSRAFRVPTTPSRTFVPSNNGIHVKSVAPKVPVEVESLDSSSPVLPAFKKVRKEEAFSLNLTSPKVPTFGLPEKVNTFGSNDSTSPSLQHETVVYSIDSNNDDVANDKIKTNTLGN